MGKKKSQRNNFQKPDKSFPAVGIGAPAREIEAATEDAIARRLFAERETCFRNMVNNAPIMIWTVGTARNWKFFNKTWIEYTGSSPRDIEWTELVHQDDRDMLLTSLNNAFVRRKSFQVEYRLRNKEGNYRWVSSSVKPGADADDRFDGFIGVTIDIHDQKTFIEKLSHCVNERTKALQETNKHLHQSNGELRQFAYVASHDLQEPLRKILTFSNIVKKYFREDRKDEIGPLIDKIAESASRMSMLIEDLLNFSRSIRPDLKFTTVDLDDVLSKVLEDFDETIRRGKVIIRRLPLGVINGIPLQIGQLFHNLISNAIKFSAAAPKPLIQIGLSKLTKSDFPDHLIPDKKYIKISIKDNGIGFDQQYAEQIFVIFQRLHDKKTFPGTGIGLALCKKIVANHGGYISAESRPGRGATFHVILPVMADE